MGCLAGRIRKRLARLPARSDRLLRGAGVQRSVTRLRAAALIWLCLPAACAAPRPPDAAPTQRDALWRIVQQQCLPDWRQNHDPAPCVQLVTDGLSQGYVVLADRKGGAHFLLIPVQRLSGIEDARVLRADSPNYFEAAWQAREVLVNAVGHAVRRDAVGLAINPLGHRGQDQLHIHVACLQPRVQAQLQLLAPSLNADWSAVRLNDAPYLALRVMGESLDGVNPFALLAHRVRAQSMGAYSLLVAGMQFPNGPGFIVLAGRSGTTLRGVVLPPPAWPPTGEMLLDGNCAIER
jgi:CDP-diacylglycerol pyrophosphatase